MKTVELKNITKVFGKVVVNQNINLTLKKGEVLALLGENGAGKTTLMNILYGLYQPTSGEIFINENKVKIKSPKDAIKLGIGMVHQHFMLVEPFTVAENIILGSETCKAGFLLDMKTAVKKVTVLSKKYGLDVDVNAKIQDISVGMQQRVEILKTLYRGADILIFDEPTAVLTPQEITEFMKIVKNLTNEGKSVIIITHKLKEIKIVADYCTIIRRGKYIDTVKVADVTEHDLAAKMVGREVSFKVDKAEIQAHETILELKDVIVKNNRKLNAVKGLNLELKKGEILGVAGIDGNGQSELVEAITGLRKLESGSVLLHGKNISNKTPKEIIREKISMIPEDRQKRGLLLDFSVGENMIIKNYKSKNFSRYGVLNYKNIYNFAKVLIKKFDVRPENEHIHAKALSGGNQQKVIIAREVTDDPDVLIAVQPTRGLDVGAIEFVHKSIVEQRNKGKAVLLVSLELDEVLSLSDRIAVIYEGKIVNILNASETDEKELGLLMAGGAENA